MNIDDQLFAALYGPSHLDDPNRRLTFNSTARPASSAGSVLHGITILAAWVPVTEEVWIDSGGEPWPGYWERELAQRIARRRIRTRLRGARYRLTHRWPSEARRRVEHAARALRGIECERES